nr:3'-5' exonuclease [Rhizobium halophytocola]
MQRLAGAMFARSHAHVEDELDDEHARFLGDLGTAASAATSSLSKARGALTEAVARETARLSADKARLEELLSDVPPGVLLCTGGHRVAFYNSGASQLLGDDHTALGLDKPVFDYLDEHPLRQAHARLLDAEADDIAIQLTCDTIRGQRRLAVRMRLAGDSAEDPGAYVMTLRDVTAELTTNASRDRLLAEVFDRLLPAIDHLHRTVSGIARETSPTTADDIVRLQRELHDLHDSYQGCRAEPPVAPAVPQAARRLPAERHVVYDFELLRRLSYERISDARLDDLTYVVFDTETTGLLPEKGDAIVQLAAVRIVNGRRIEAEVFDTLVDPQRPIPAASTAVHGITDAMVADAPDIAEATARFHRFSKGAVLVAHNAPFDMEFLRRAERQAGVRFDNPILDTVLLSAVVFGQSEAHSLDALAERLGVEIPPEARHTAIGDTMATADVFLKLKSMLQARGDMRFGEVLSEVRRHGRLLRDLNPQEP